MRASHGGSQYSVRDTSSPREQQTERSSDSRVGIKDIHIDMEDEDDYYFDVSDDEYYEIVYGDASEYDETADEDKCEILKSMREEVQWAVEDERRELLRRLGPLIINWWDHLPDLRDVFQAGEIDWLLSESATEVRDLRDCIRAQRFVEFVIRTGYEDEPELDEAGEPLLSRTTALHRAVECQNYDTVPYLFEIYSRFDANYADEAGFTHFHAACQADCDDVVERFLELGQVDPDYPVVRTGDAPLHVALRAGGRKVARLLLSKGADPNRANAEGLTPLHVTSQRFQDDDLSDVLFEREGNRRRIEINARDRLGRTPLHHALAEGLVNETERLLRRGADPSLADDHGATPLHVICKRAPWVDSLARRFLEMCDEMNRPVNVDVEDTSGRTPLQWAVAKLMPDVVNLLLDRGADLSSFRFPSEDYFAPGRRSCECGDKNDRLEFRVRLAARALMVVERLEERGGYRLAGNDVLVVMKPFAEYGLFAETEDCRAALDDEYFARMAKEHALNETMSFHDLVQLPVGGEETEKLSFGYKDYYEFVGRREYLYLDEEPSEACARHVCETMSRRFFRKKTLDFFVELTRHELPILCCERILKQRRLTNQDLYNVCLAATIQNM